MKKNPAGRILLMLLLITAAFTSYAHDCSGGTDCNNVPYNNTGAHAVAGLLAMGATVIAVVTNNNKRKKEEKKKEEDIDLEKEFISFGEEEDPDAEEEEKEKKNKPRTFFDEPLGEDPPVTDR